MAATAATPSGLVYTSLPADGLVSVLGSTAFKVRFDRLLLPVSVARQSVCIQPALQTVLTPGECTSGLFLQPTYEPVRREAIFRQAPGAAPLVAGNLFAFTAYTAADPGLPGFRSFEGTPMPTRVRYELGVQDAVPVADAPPPADPYCAPRDPDCTGAGCARSVAAVFAACGSCHAGAEAAAGLDLATAKGLSATAISRAARGSQTGEHAASPDAIALRFGRSMPIVDPAAPGNSYLIYKLLANPHTPLEVPFLGPDGVVPPEVLRVQSTIITGLPMPPDNAPAAALRPGEAEWISTWILAGAPVRDTCP